jgi:hypothetical protein
MPSRDRPARTYDANRMSDPRLPDHIRARLRYHFEAGHTNVRVTDCTDRGYLLESFRDGQGTVAINRYALVQEESGDPA